MRLLIALLLPWLQFFTIGRPIAGIICLIAATHTYRLAAGRHLVGIRPEPIQNRPKNTQRAEQPTSLTEGRLKTKPRG